VSGRAAIIALDYDFKRRLKIFGHARIDEWGSSLR
jgi:hypothetical protein